MNKYYLLFIIVALPLLISGCFLLGKKAPEEKKAEVAVYENQSLGEASYKVSYPVKWKMEEETTGALGEEVKDSVVFKPGDSQIIAVKTVKASSTEDLLKLYNIEEQSQTEVSRFLADRIIGTLKENEQKQEAVIIKNGNYFYTINTNTPGSPEYIQFLIDFNINVNLNLPKPEETPVAEEPGNLPVYKLYFGNSKASGQSCQATYFREVNFENYEDEIALIPIIMKGLLFTDELRLDELNLFTAIPGGTKLLSYGYENNKVIVNFNAALNAGGGSCSMEMRRSQIEQTLKSLNEVSNLQIKAVEIQVEGDRENVLQP